MFKVGRYNILKVETIVDFGVYLTDGESEVLLPQRYVPEGTVVGNKLKVFLYFDSEDRLIATTLEPRGQVGDIVTLPVKEVTKIGAFLDWGLPKDLFVPFKEQRQKMQEGREYVVKICYDKVSKRLLGSSRFRPTADKDVSFKPGEKVDLLVCEKTDLGFAVLINHEFPGMLYHTDVFSELAPGDELPGYILKQRPDGKVDVTLRKPGFSGVLDTKPLILEKLREAGGFLPFNSQTSPETIKQKFNMSKKVFKQAIGGLYKERAIEITEDGIQLLKQK